MSAISFLLFYSAIIVFTYSLIYLGSPSILGSTTIAGTNYTYSEQNTGYQSLSSMSKLEMFFAVTSTYYWINIILIPFGIVIAWIIIAWLRGIDP